MFWNWGKNKQLATLLRAVWLLVFICPCMVMPARAYGAMLPALPAKIERAASAPAVMATSTAVPSEAVATTVTILPIPEPTPTQNMVQDGNLLPTEAIAAVQHILWQAGYLLPGQEETMAQTGVLDQQTRSAIRFYLSELYAIPAWTRDYFTEPEYLGLLEAHREGKIPSRGLYGSPLPTISSATPFVPTMTPSPTPAPTGIQILSPAASADGSALLIPNELAKGLAVTGTAQPGWDVEVTLCSDQNSIRRLVNAAKSGVFSVVFTREECARFNGAVNTRVTAEYPKLPAAFAAVLAIDYHTTRDGGAALVKVHYTHRDEELRISGLVNAGLMPLTLQSDTGVELSAATSTKDGAFLFRLDYAMRNGRPVSGQYRLILNGDALRPETLKVSAVEQETLLPFTRNMSTGEVMWFGAALITLSGALLLACLLSRRERRNHGKASGTGGGDTVG